MKECAIPIVIGLISQGLERWLEELEIMGCTFFLVLKYAIKTYLRTF